MSIDQDLRELAASADVVVFHSTVTDLGGLDEVLADCGRDWRAVEMGMGSAENRDQFARLKALTGSTTLPQVFIGGHFVGGLRAATDRLQAEGRHRLAADWVGYLGLIPFVATAAGPWLGMAWTGDWLLAYGAVILSFIGAIHWGLAMGRRNPPPTAFLASVIPALVAWGVLMLPLMIGLPLMAAAFIAWRYAEYRLIEATLPRWFRRLRTVLSAGAAAALVAGWLALLVSTGTA
jgi:glutaredoxin